MKCLTKQQIFTMQLLDEMEKCNRHSRYSDIVILCVGTDRIIGDSYGPIVGALLKEKLKNKAYTVYGSLDMPVTYSNLETTIKSIRDRFINPCIIIVDAALSRIDYVGGIFVKGGKTKLAEGVNKNIRETGNISIRGIVGENKKEHSKNLEALKNGSLSMVIELSQITANGIIQAINNITMA
ncbi:MAG: spore protease YyaC [Clostridia bacterium]|nr:spore protease YyaC [Clostridia bacterium]